MKQSLNDNGVSEKIWKKDKVLKEGMEIYRSVRVSNDNLKKEGFYYAIKKRFCGDPSFWADDKEYVKSSYATWNDNEDITCFLIKAEIIKNDNLFADYKVFKLIKKAGDVDRNGKGRRIRRNALYYQKMYSVTFANLFFHKKYSGVIDSPKDILISDHSIYEIKSIWNINKASWVDIGLLPV